ncbi:MAG TPA: hypothetical protein VGC79_01065 [Polyangiaceae bacterium]
MSGRIPVKSDTLAGLNHSFLSTTDAAEARHVAAEASDEIARFIQQP